MADIFLKKDVKNLLAKKKIVYFGDSNIRYLYKDLVWLSFDNSLIPVNTLIKREESVCNGESIMNASKASAKRSFQENRRYLNNNFEVEFYFITRCFNKQIKSYLNDIKNKVLPAPEVILMNSTIWDLTRWGPKGADQFKNDLNQLMECLKSSLPEKTIFIWSTAFPPGKKIRAQALLVKQVEFLEHLLRFDIMEANLYAKNIVVKNGFDVLDFHYHLRMQIHRRRSDGLHYSPLPIRFLTNIFLTHLALSWNHTLPNNIHNSLLNRYKNMAEENNLSLCSNYVTRKVVKREIVLKSNEENVKKDPIKTEVVIKKENSSNTKNTNNNNTVACKNEKKISKNKRKKLRRKQRKLENLNNNSVQIKKKNVNNSSKRRKLRNRGNNFCKRTNNNMMSSNSYVSSTNYSININVNNNYFVNRNNYNQLPNDMPAMWSNNPMDYCSFSREDFTVDRYGPEPYRTNSLMNRNVTPPFGKYGPQPYNNCFGPWQ